MIVIPAATEMHLFAITRENLFDAPEPDASAYNVIDYFSGLEYCGPVIGWMQRGGHFSPVVPGDVIEIDFKECLYFLAPSHNLAWDMVVSTFLRDRSLGFVMTVEEVRDHAVKGKVMLDSIKK